MEKMQQSNCREELVLELLESRNQNSIEKSEVYINKEVKILMSSWSQKYQDKSVEGVIVEVFKDNDIECRSIIRLDTHTIELNICTDDIEVVKYLSEIMCIISKQLGKSILITQWEEPRCFIAMKNQELLAWWLVAEEIKKDF